MTSPSRKPARFWRPRQTTASRSSTPLMSMATAAASGSSGSSLLLTPTPGSPWPPRWGVGSTRCPRTTPPRTSGAGSTGRGAISAPSSSTWCSCTARRRSVIEADATYDALDALVADASIAAYGLSVETCDQALAAIARPGVASIQIILNALRLKPLDQVLPAAAQAGVGIIARVPLASGLLSGRYAASTTFAPDDHRTLQPRRQRVRRGGDVLGSPVGGRPGGGRGLLGAGRAAARRRPRPRRPPWRGAGSSRGRPR